MLVRNVIVLIGDGSECVSEWSECACTVCW